MLARSPSAAMGAGRTVRTLKRRMAFTGPKHSGTDGPRDCQRSCRVFTVLQVGLAGWPGDASAPGPGSVVRVTASPLPPAAQRPLGRIPVLNVAPVVDGGAFPAKSVVDEEFDVTATVFREGHDAVNATVVLTDPDRRGDRRPDDPARTPAWTTGRATVSAGRTGLWSYRVEGWSDPYGTWEHDATIKVEADVDTELMLEEGARVLERAARPRSRAPRSRPRR